MTDKNQVLVLATVKLYREQFKVEKFVSQDDFLILVESGSFLLESENGRYEIKAGECAYLKRNTCYKRKIIQLAKLHLFRFHSPQFLVSKEHLKFKDEDRIKSTIKLLNRIDDLPSLNETERKTHLFFDIINQYILENECTAEKIDKSDALMYETVLKLQSRLYENLPFTEYAKESGLSYAQFFRRFKAYTGLTPSEYVNALRMKKAKKLLIESSLQIKEISDILGFENEYYFSNFFKKHLKVSPSAYRKIIT